MTMHRHTLPLSLGNFLPKTSLLSSPATVLFSVFQLKIKGKGRHFEGTEVIEAESKEVLNNLTVNDFQDAFKNGRHTGNGVYPGEETTSRVMLVNSPKVTF
jgi:hypothetical protein